MNFYIHYYWSKYLTNTHQTPEIYNILRYKQPIFGNKESKRMIAGVEKMAKILPKSNTYTEILRDENHNTIFPIGLIHGMKKTTTSGKKI